MFRSFLNSFRRQKTVVAKRRSVSLSIDRFEDRLVPASVSNAGGYVIPNVQVETVYYGSAWTDATNAQNPQLRQEAKDLNAFASDITQSSYMNSLSQYTGLGYQQVNLPWVSFRAPYGAAPGKGSFIGSDSIATGALNAAGNVDEVAIVNSLKADIASGKLPAPDANKLYMVFMAPGMRSQFDVTNANGGGHHAAFMTSSGPAYYAIIDNPADGFAAAGMPAQATAFQKFTATASHELVESITNPADWDKVPADGGSANIPAWIDSAGNEIGDITQSTPPAGGVMSTIDGYLVQKYWSQTAGTSVAPGGVDYAALLQVPATLQGTHFTLTALQAGWKPTAQLQFEDVTISANPGLANFHATWLGTDGQFADAYGTLQVSGGLSVNLVVKRSTDNAVLYVGTLAAPTGNWTSGIEISPEKIGDSAFFGVQDTSSASSVDWNYVNGAYPPIPVHKGPITWA
jgi:hypothetical protein